MTRISFVPLIGILSIGAVALAGCGSSTGTNGSQGTAVTPIGSAASNTDGGSPAASSGNWVLSAPGSIFGFARIQPQAATLDKIQSELTKRAPALGVSGAPVIAVYDDPTHDVYLILAGYNGTGFEPGRMKSVFDVVPIHTSDGAGDHYTINSESIDPGAHGGAAGCASTLMQGGALAAESTTCVWLTSTTMGSISYYPKPDHRQMVFGTGPDVMGKVMRDLRDQVEHRA